MAGRADGTQSSSFQRSILYPKHGKRNTSCKNTVSTLELPTGPGSCGDRQRPGVVHLSTCTVPQVCRSIRYLQDDYQASRAPGGGHIPTQVAAGPGVVCPRYHVPSNKKPPLVYPDPHPYVSPSLATNAFGDITISTPFEQGSWFVCYRSTLLLSRQGTVCRARPPVL
ncbi:hypothetical protein Bbelb_233180 [Branchiostoma belcheri]|nr:hypothetical protein Bbelb_233180 [Branchiostoma belcheri]